MLQLQFARVLSCQEVEGIGDVGEAVGLTVELVDEGVVASSDSGNVADPRIDVLTAQLVRTRPELILLTC